MSKPFKELCYTDDFMFCKVMQNEDICKGVLELLLGIRIRKIRYLEPQKAFTGAFDTHGIRLDIYTEDDENRVFDVEMQTYDDELPRRSRFYNGMIDRKLLHRGADYKELKDCFIIFISKANPFEDINKCLYVFENRCRDVPGLVLGDGVQKVFVTPDGDDQGLSKEIREFLQYLREPGNVGAENALLDSIESTVQENRLSAEMEEEYMYIEEYERRWMEEGMAKGMIQGRAEGKAEGKAEERANLYSLVQDGDLDPQKAAAKLGLSLEEFEKQMNEAGFKVPNMA